MFLVREKICIAPKSGFNGSWFSNRLRNFNWPIALGRMCAISDVQRLPQHFSAFSDDSELTFVTNHQARC